MKPPVISYSNLIDNAMRSVVRESLRLVSATGLPGEHHFFITFLTGYPGVKISPTLSARYPREMTVVLQHQFWDFKVEEQGFGVTLSFGGVPEKLYIPFAAMTAFADPSVKFGLQFQQDENAEPAQNDAAPPTYTGAATREPQHEDVEQEPENNTAEIISLDSFRKK